MVEEEEEEDDDTEGEYDEVIHWNCDGHLNYYYF